MKNNLTKSLIFIAVLMLCLTVNTKSFAGRDGGSGWKSYTHSQLVFDSAVNNLVMLLPELVKRKVNPNLNEDNLAEFIRLITHAEILCDTEAFQPITNKRLMLDHYPRKERGETGIAKIMVVKDFCVAYMNTELEDIDLKLPGVMRKLIVEAAHTDVLGFDDNRADPFSFSLVPRINSENLISLNQNDPTRIASYIISNIFDNKSQDQYKKATKSLLATELNKTADEILMQVESFQGYLSAGLIEVKAASDSQDKESASYIAAGKDAQDRSDRALFRAKRNINYTFHAKNIINPKIEFIRTLLRKLVYETILADASPLRLGETIELCNDLELLNLDLNNLSGFINSNVVYLNKIKNIVEEYKKDLEIHIIK
jgi:hypothetical protein